MTGKNDTFFCFARSLAYADYVARSFFREKYIKNGLVENELGKDYEKSECRSGKRSNGDAEGEHQR